MIPYGKQKIDNDDIAAVTGVLQSDFLTQGPAVAAFEEALSVATGAPYVVAVSSGTAALHVAYLAAGLGAGDEVITTPNTFVATANMLLAVGAVPVFCDISLDTYNIDETKIEALVTPRTKAIVAVDFAGRPCAYKILREIADKHNLFLIEDGAHSLGATYEGQPIGTQADLTTISFHPVKPITTAEGGAVLTSDKALYERARLFRSHGVQKDAAGFNVMTELGFNYRLPDVLAALGTSQLTKLPVFIEKRREVATWYEESLATCAHIVRPLTSVESGWHIYVIRVKDPADRIPLYRHLIENGVGANFHYPAVYSHPYYRSHGYESVSLEQMDIYDKTSITLPCHVHLTREDIDLIVDKVELYFSQKTEVI
ncbi:MAG: DegT/DnrJ/EryC1/StrS family aminotransferase [Patescibacteria group bacterium]